MIRKTIKFLKSEKTVEFFSLSTSKTCLYLLASILNLFFLSQVYSKDLIDGNNPAKWTGKIDINKKEIFNEKPAFEISSKGIKRIIYKDFIPVNPDNRYVFSAYMRSLDAKLPASAHLGIYMYTADKKLIGIRNVRNLAGTENELLQQAYAGSRELLLKKQKGYVGKRNCVLAFGAEDNYADLPNYDLSPPIKEICIENGKIKITLTKPLAKTYPKGTKVRLHSRWSSSFYWGISGWMPAEWEKYSVTMQGTALCGTPSTQLWSGTKYIRPIFWFGNYSKKPKEGAKLLLHSLQLQQLPSIVKKKGELITSLFKAGKNGNSSVLHISNCTLHLNKNGKKIRENSIVIKGISGSQAVLNQNIKLEKNKRYIVSAWIKSPNALSLQISSPGNRLKKYIAYCNQGKWQKITGIFASMGFDNYNLRLTLRKIAAEDKLEAEISTLTLSELKTLPQPVRDARISGTSFVDRNSLYIVIPQLNKSIYQRYAGKIQKVFSDIFSFTPEIITDTQACPGKAPIISEKYAGANLILLGRLGINRAVWPGYNRFLCAADAYYPGNQGFAVRTMVNVLRNRKNHILLASSSDAGVAKAVNFFIDCLKKQAAVKNEKVCIPYLQKIVLSSQCLDDFQTDEQMWNSNSKNLPFYESGYRTVCRWYQNAMGYYFSGRESYKKRCRELTDRLISEQAYTHHYVMEFFIRTWSMLQYSGILSAQQRDGIDKLLFKNYCDFQVGPDLMWMKDFSPPYTNISIYSRHNISPWIMQCSMSDFFKNNFILKGQTRDLIDFTCSEIHKLLTGLLTGRWRENATAKGKAMAERKETGLTFLRYALENEIYSYFDDGNAAKILELDHISHVSGRTVQPTGYYKHNQVMNVLGSYFRDGAYKWLSKNIPVHAWASRKRAPFEDRYIGRTHFYNIDSTIKAEYPKNFTGLRIAKFMPTDLKYLSAFNYLAGYKNYIPFAKMNQAVDIAVIREGFKKNDDFLMVSGCARSYMLPGDIGFLCSGGYSWLSAWNNYTFNNGDNAFKRNSVYISRQNKLSYEQAPYNSISTLAGKCAFPGFEYFALDVTPYMETSWRREFIRLGHGLFVVNDSFTGLNDAPLDIIINWKPFGRLRANGNSITSIQGKKRFSMTLLSDDFTISQNLNAAETGAFSTKIYERDRLHLRNIFSGPITKGRKISATNILKISDDNRKFSVRRLGNGRMLLTGEKVREVCFGAFDDGQIASDAKVLVLDKDFIFAVACKKLQVNGNTVYQSKQAVNLKIDLSGKKIIFADNTKGISTEYSGWKTLNTCIIERFAKLRATKAEKLVHKKSDGRMGEKVKTQSREVWSYEKFLRPSYIDGAKKVGGDVVDLGGNFMLAEIRNCRSRNMSVELSEMWACKDTGNGKIPPANSPLWKKLPAPEWVPGVISSNYGYGKPTKKSYQRIILKKAQPARFVRGACIRKYPVYRWGLSFYNAAKPESTHPLDVELTDVNNDGKKEVFIYTHIPKIWPRGCRVEDAGFALLTQDGKEIFKYLNIRAGLQDLKVIDYTGDNNKEILMATQDGIIKVFNWRGKIIRSFDLYEMQQEFHRKYGRPNTRHPAAGYTTPYAIGLWRKQAEKPYKMILTRYGHNSFLDGDGKLEGVLKGPGWFCRPYILPYGVDFNGDGEEETLLLDKSMLIHVDGSAKPRVRNPGSNVFWPEVYNVSRLTLPSHGKNTYPDKIYIFKPLNWAGGNKYVLLVSEKYIAIYDALHRKWVYRWTPLISIEKTAITKNGPDSLQIVIYSEDNTLALISWEKRLDRMTGFSKIRSSGLIKNIYSRALPGNKTLTLLAGNQGIYRLNKTQELVKIIDGAFYDAKPLCTDGKLKSVFASTIRGKIIRFDLKDK